MFTSAIKKLRMEDRGVVLTATPNGQSKKEKKMVNYFDVCVSAARMLNKPQATKKELVRVVRNMFSYVGKQLDESAFNVAFTEFAQAKGARYFKPIYS